MNDKYLLTVDFRYTIRNKDEEIGDDYKTEIITIGVFDSKEEAISKGNESLKIFDKFYKRNPNYRKLAEFSKNGGCFGSMVNLITDSEFYPQIRYSFFMKITTLKYEDLEQKIINIEQKIKK